MLDIDIVVAHYGGFIQSLLIAIVDLTGGQIRGPTMPADVQQLPLDRDWYPRDNGPRAPLTANTNQRPVCAVTQRILSRL